MATKKRREKSNKAKLGDLRRLLTPLTANSGDLGHLEATRTRFAEVLAPTKSAYSVSESADSSPGPETQRESPGTRSQSPRTR